MSSDKNENPLPTVSADITEAEQRMDLKDKLKLIDKEVRELYEFCVKAGYSPAQIEQCASPLLSVQTSEKRKSWLKRLGYLVAIVAFIAFLFYYDPAYNQVCIYAKLASLKVIPYWDWTYIYEQNCFIYNPYMEEDRLTKNDCKESCAKLQTISIVEKTDAKEISEYLFNDEPVVITDATDNWRARSDFSIGFLAELYHKNQVLRETGVCNFQTTTGVEYHDHPKSFLQDVVSGKVNGSYQTYWENCGLESAKVLRQFYRRPYFLPPMVEASEGNWMIVSFGGKKSLKVTWSASITWLSQITGRSRVILTPDRICKGICQKLTMELGKGESIIFSNDMWSMSYKPMGDEPVIAIGSTGTFDRI